MSLEKGLEWSHKNLNFKGYSIAGQSTSLVFNEPKICFDVAQGLPFALPSKLFCLTHLHADHGAGLNYLLSQRSLFRLPKVPVLLPEASLEPMSQILKQWQKIEGFEYAYELIGVNQETTFKLSDRYLIKSFPTTHRISSFGYLVYETKKKLKKEFQSKSREEILAAKQQGLELETNVQEPLVAFTGDTQIEFLDAHPDIKKAKVLFMECTYLDEKKSIEETRKWGHLHFDELLPRLHQFENEKICLIHLSARYSTHQAEKILQQKLTVEQRQRLALFPRPF